MIDLMKQAVNALKTKVAFNLEEIRSNESRFRTMVAEGMFYKRSFEINAIVSKNKALLSQNIDLINIQINMLKFIEKYQCSYAVQNIGDFLPEAEEMVTNNDIFNLTASGELPYLPNHPLFDDNQFFNQLMDYYKTNEAYEKCSELNTIKSFYNLN